MFKNLTNAALGLLIVAVGGGVFAFTQPSGTQTTVAAVNYNHQGSFNYTARQQASYVFGDLPIDDVSNGQPAPAPAPPQANPKYPIQYIDALNMSFSYQITANAAVSTSADVSIAALYQKDSKQQTLALPAAVSVAGGVYTARFSLPLVILLTSPTFTIQATVYSTIGQGGMAPVFESYTQGLAFQAQAPYLEINKTLENSTQASFGALTYKQSGAFSYAVSLNAASPYGAIILTPPGAAVPPTPTPPVLSAKIFKPGDAIFSDLFSSMNVSYSYKMNSDVPVNQQSETVQLLAVLENPGVWTKNFILVPSTVKSGPFTVNFVLTAEDLANYIAVYQAVRQETGSTADFSLAIVATVHTTGQTDFGPIDDTFTQTLSTKLGEATLAWNEKLTLAKSGTINQLQTVPNKIKYIGLTVTNARIITSVVTGFALVALVALFIWITWRRRGGYRAADPETERIQGLFKDSLIKVAELPQPTTNETIVKTESADDLARTGMMTLKPVLYYRQADGQDVYCVIDGSTRYQYMPSRG